METINRAGLMRIIRAPQIMHVNHATFIPSGMHGVGGVPEKIEHRDATEQVFKKLVGRGIHPNVARGLVTRAKMRHHGRTAHQQKHRGFTYVRRAGVGDDEVGPQMPPELAAAQRLEAITADARKVQAAHQGMINTMAGWTERTPDWVTNDDNLRLTFVNQLTDLKDQFIRRSLPVLGVEFPYQIERTDPAGAVVIAVRDDIMGTIDLLDARKAQQLLQRHISDLPKPGGGIHFEFPKIDIPWYVWVLGGSAALGVGTKALHLW